MLPRRLETSTVQSPEMRSRAGADMALGKRTLPSTILENGSGCFYCLGKSYALFVDFHGVLVPEGWLANEELIDQDAEGPPVYCCAMAWGLSDVGLVLGRDGKYLYFG